MSDGLDQLERDQRRGEGNVLHSDASTIERSEGRKIPRDPELEEGAWFEAGFSGRHTTARSLEGAVREVVYGDGDLAEGMVPGPDGRKVGGVGKMESETDENIVKLDEWGKKNEPDDAEEKEWGEKTELAIIEVSYRPPEEIKNPKAREATRAFILNWKDRSVADDEFKLEVGVSKKGKLLLVVDRHGKRHSFPAWMLKKVLTVKSVDLPETEKGSFSDEDIVSEWQSFINKLVIDDFARPGAVVKAGRGLKWRSEEGREGTDGRLVLRSRIDEIRSDAMHVEVEKVLSVWRGEPLDVRLFDDKKGRRRVSFDAVKGRPSLPLDFFLQYCLGGRWMRGENGSGDYVGLGNFNVDETTTAEELQKHLGEFELDEHARKMSWSEGE